MRLASFRPSCTCPRSPNTLRCSPFPWYYLRGMEYNRCSRRRACRDHARKNRELPYLPIPKPKDSKLPYSTVLAKSICASHVSWITVCCSFARSISHNCGSEDIPSRTRVATSMHSGFLDFIYLLFFLSTCIDPPHSGVL